MNPADEHTTAVMALLTEEPSAPEDMPAPVGRLQRLCRVASRDLPASGVGVSLMSESGDLVSTAASNGASAAVEELQFTMGEGPCLAAFASRRPVLVPDITEGDGMSWLGYGPAALEQGVRAVFAFPLQVGAARLGALDVYRDRPGALSMWALSRALTYADVAMQTVLDADGGAEETALLLTDGDGVRWEVYQAQGMVMALLRVGAAEALSRIRAYAYANDRPLREVADAIVSRRVVLERDDDPEP